MSQHEDARMEPEKGDHVIGAPMVRYRRYLQTSLLLSHSSPLA